MSSGAGRPAERDAGRGNFFAEAMVGIGGNLAQRTLRSQRIGLGISWRTLRPSREEKGLITLGGFAEIIRGLVGAGLFLLDLAEEVVEERGGAEAVPRVVEPVVAEGLL